MSNPLARVVMSGIVQSKGGSTTKSNTNNLEKREVQLLTSLLDNKKNGGSSSSYNKNTYGRTTNASKSQMTMQTLNSLVTGKPSQEEKIEALQNKARKKELKSLCNLSNLAVGKTNECTGANMEMNRTSDRNLMQTLSLNDLVKGGSKSSVKESKTSYKNNKQTSGMTTLGDLVKTKSKNKQDNDKSLGENNNRNDSNIRSTVINNLEAYIPKVTLESIGKKGSLF